MVEWGSRSFIKAGFIMNITNIRKYLAGLGIALGTSALIVFILSQWGLFQQIELLLMNLRHEIRYARESDRSLSENVHLQTAREGKSPDIHVIKMDEHAFSAFGPFPWERSTYARPLEKFSQGQLTISLSWNGIQDPAHARYCVYQSESPIRTTDDLAKATLSRTIASADEQIFSDILIVKPGRWYFAVTSVDTNGVENRHIAFGTNTTRFPVNIQVKPTLAAEAQQWDKQYQLGMIREQPKSSVTNSNANLVGGLYAILNYPEAVFFDVFMLDHKDKDDDQVLINSFAKNSSVFVDYKLNDDNRSPNPPDFTRRIEALQRHTIAADQTQGERSEIYAPGVSLPIPEVIESVDGAGFANAVRDADETIRSWKLVSRFEDEKYPNRYYPSAPLLLAMKYFRVPPEKVRILPGESVTLMDAEYRIRDKDGKIARIERKDLVIPVDSNGVLDIHYIGPHGTFVEHQDELSSFASFEKYSLSSLSDKIFMIGLFELAIKADDKTTDYWLTPVGQMFGIEVMANTLNTIITGNFLQRASSQTNALVVFMVAVLLALVLARLSTLKGAIFALGMTLLFIIIAYALYTGNYILNMSMPLAAVFFTFLGTTIYKTLTEEAEKKYIRTQFGKFVNKNVVDELLKDPSKLRLGGERRSMTVLFSDIRGFTTLSEGLEAEDLVQLLNSYLSRMTDIVIRYDGTLDKYVGDEIMAFWGAPLSQPDHAMLACRTAVDMIASLEKLNAGLPEEKRLRIGIGLNSGEMLVGQIGSESRMDYTVIGDNVNLGARLEGTNKVYGTSIIISEATLDLVRDRVVVRELDMVRVKGKHKPVTIYELVDIAGD